MTEPDNLRSRLLAHLLHELPPNERKEMDEKILRNQEFSDQILKEENDLIEDYHSGRLNPEERRRVEVAFGRDRLLKRAPIHLPETSGRNLTGSSIRGTRVALFAAAVILLIVGVLVALFHRSSPQATPPKPAQSGSQTPGK